MIVFFVLFVGAYLIGSIPFDFLLVKKIKGVDIRRVGSGNAGATNVKRVLGWQGAIFAYLLDTLKGSLPVFLAFQINFPIWQVTLIGVAAVFGHIFPLFLGFKGGKGVSTAGGVFLMLNPLAVAIAFLVWVVIYLTTKYSSLGSLLAAISVFTAQVLKNGAWKFNAWPVTVLSLLMMTIVLISHRGNIVRLLQGQENRA